MPTARGLGVCALAVAFYVNGRLFGTVELYLVAYALALLVGVSWLWTGLAARSLHLGVALDPETVVSGDRVEVRLQLENRSRLPVLGCRARLDLSVAGGGAAECTAALLLPGGVKRGTTRSGTLWRGSYELPPGETAAGDPFGLAERRSLQGGNTTLLVLPRLSKIEDFELLAGRVLGIGLKPGTTVKGAGEFRGIRPHQPGEPLSRVHWKSTAKTGILMLRETEDAPRAQNVVLVDGWVQALVGERPVDTFEKSIVAAGTLADALLQRGVPLDLVLHGKDEVSVALEGAPAGRHHLRELLAQASPTAPGPLGEVIGRSLTRISRNTSLMVVSPAWDRSLQLPLLRLAERRVPILLVHVSPSSFRGEPAGVNERAFLLTLERAGVVVLVLGRDDDPGEALTAMGRAAVPTGGITASVPVAG